MFNYIFIQAGSVVRREADKLTIQGYQNLEVSSVPYGVTFVLDVGNSLGDGIIDHHQPGTEDQCVASMIANSADKWIGRHLKESEEYWIVTHSSPDFDALGSVYLTEKYIREHSLPAFAFEFADYILEVDSGRKKLNKDHIIEPFSLVLAISENIRRDSSIMPEHKDFETLKVTFKLFDSLLNMLSEGKTIVKFDWERLSNFQEHISLINNDFAVYTEDLTKRSEIYQISLPEKRFSRFLAVDCLTTRFPQSILWKYWARGDADHSPDYKGFIMTVAFLPSENTRAIIAVDPTSNLTLKGLGLYLDYLEMKRCLDNAEIEDIVGNKRPGFHRENPWYDGRSSMHNYTIIDTPRGGSMLSEDDIMNAIFNTRIWSVVFPDREYDELSVDEILDYFDEDLHV